MSTEERYEYVAVAVSTTGFNDEKRVTDRINEVAAHGWRLAQAISPPKGPAYLIYERPTDA